MVNLELDGHYPSKKEGIKILGFRITEFDELLKKNHQLMVPQLLFSLSVQLPAFDWTRNQHQPELPPRNLMKTVVKDVLSLSLSVYIFKLQQLISIIFLPSSLCKEMG